MKPLAVVTVPKSDFRVLIAAINTGCENAIVDEAARVVRARLKSKKCRCKK
jgi:hypothetical protein